MFTPRAEAETRRVTRNQDGAEFVGERNVGRIIGRQIMPELPVELRSTCPGLRPGPTQAKPART